MILLAASQWLWIIGIVVAFSTEFPNPQKEFQLCGRKNASFICDPEFILDGGDADRLNHLSLNFMRSTTCLCPKCENGISLGIFIRSSVSPEISKAYPTGKSIAEMIRKRWHLGKCNDDIVIILVTGMNISEYSMGPTVQEVFPDETAKLIMQNCRTHFLSTWYYQGFESVVTSLTDVFMKIQKEKKSSTAKKNLIIGICLGIGVLLILIIAVLLLLRRQRKRRKSGCSDIYQSVPTKRNNDDFLNDKINEYQIQKLKQNKDEESDEDNNKISQQFLPIKRHITVIQESDDYEDLGEKDLSFNKLYPSLGNNRSTQVTEL